MKTTALFLVVLAMTTCSRPIEDRFPSRPIELVIAFPPGGVTDLAGRLFADGLSKTLKVPVIATNRGGGSGVLGATVASRARKDGYTLLVNSISGMVLGPAVMRDVSFAADRDFLPIALILTVPQGLIVRANSPFKTVDDLIEAARRHPGQLSYASPGTASDGHFNGEVLTSSANIKMKHVPFTSGGELAAAVMGGHVDLGIGAATSFISLAHGGKVRTLAVTGKTRLKMLPDVPTFEERGLPGNFIDSWAGCFVPAGTPQMIVNTLVDAATRVVRSPVFITKVAKTGGIAQYMPPEDILAMIRENKKTAAEVAARVGILQNR